MPRHSLRLLALALALVTSACTQSVGDINRVQPNVVRKADLLEGEWFFRNTVTWTPFDTQFTFPGQTGQMEKLVFEVQENNLVGYRAYPLSPGVESNVDATSQVSGTTATYCDKNGVCTGGQKYYGAPVVAFAIKSHFDIQRGYNPATGEVTNVIQENTTDRVWNQREFVRVDWAANLLNKNSGMNWGTVQNPAGGSSSSSWVQANEPGSDPTDWPVFEYQKGTDGQAHLNYFDVTGRYMANPDQVYFEDYGSIPACWLSGGVTDCASSEIKMRISLSRVDPTWSRDYEPLIYPNELMSLFGFFRTERLNYDRKFGYNDSAVIRLGQRHRVWKEYFQKDAQGQVVPGSPLPLTSRAPRPIVYYFTPAEKMGGQARYDEFWAPGQQLEASFDHAFRRAIAAAQQKDISEVPQMFHLCNNPVKAGDPASCGKPGFSPRIGDLRYSFVNTVAEPVANGLLGYGPSSADPETGQLMSGMSNTYLWGVDLYGRSVLDHMLLLAGEKTEKEYITGQDMRDLIARNPAYNLVNLPARTVQSALTGVPQTRDESVGAWDRPAARATALVQGLSAARGLPRSSGDELRVASERLAQRPDLEGLILDNPDAQADALGLLPPTVQEAAAQDPSLRRALLRSVLTNAQGSARWEAARLEWVSRNNIFLAEFFDHTLWGLAKAKLEERDALVLQYGQQGNPACATAGYCTPAEAKRLANDDIARSIRQSVWLATALHETGHTLNLRHNFQGSFDSVNYQDAYWDVRKSTLTVDQGGTPRLPRTPADLKTALDGTQDQLLRQMHQHEYSSIMDYSGKIYGDWALLGKYDEAAILFAYSGTTEPGYVEVFKGARSESQTFPGSDGRQVTITGAANDLPAVNAQHLNPNVRNYTERYHYTNVPLHFGEGADLPSAIDDGLAKLRARELKKYSVVKVDEDQVAAALKANPKLVQDPSGLTAALGFQPLLRVPYMFCSDESADGPVLSCNRFDRGPDYYETTRSKTADYWNYYYDSHFRRDKAWFTANRAFNGAARTFLFTADTYKHWVYELYQQASARQEQSVRAPLDATLQDTWTMAVLDGVNQHLNVMSVPSYGYFMFRKLRYGDQWDVMTDGYDYDSLNADGQAAWAAYYTSAYASSTPPTAFGELKRGLGRRMYSRFDFKTGYDFFRRMGEAGHWMDQYGAMIAAVVPTLEIQGADMVADRDRFAIPYYLVFRQELGDTFGALWSNNEQVLRPTAYLTLDEVGSPTGQLAIQYPVHVHGADLFTNFVYPQEPLKTCTGNQKPPTCFSLDQSAAPVNISSTWTARYLSLYLGMAAFNVNYDLDYSKTMEVFKLGGQEQVTPQPGYHTVESQDFLRGARYVALEKDGAAPYSTPAIRMINNANDYYRMYQDPTQCPLPEYLERLGYTCMRSADVANPAQVEDRRRYWAQVYQDGIRDLDIMRGFYSIFGKAF